MNSERVMETELQSAAARKSTFSLATLFRLVIVTCFAGAACRRLPYPEATLFVLGLAMPGFYFVFGDYRRTLISIVVVFVAYLFVYPPVNGHAPSKQLRCKVNLGNIGRAVLQFEKDHGHLPPPYLVDEDGQPMHSWRVLILPYLERQDLYDAYDFSKPWDHADNLKLEKLMPKLYQCPSYRGKDAGITTSYVAIVGDETAWPTEGNRTTTEITTNDGLPITLLVVESEMSRIHWMSPHDPLLGDEKNVKLNWLPRSNHGHGANSVFCDSCTSFLSSGISIDTWKALATYAGDEDIKDEDFLE